MSPSKSFQLKLALTLIITIFISFSRSENSFGEEKKNFKQKVEEAGNDTQRELSQATRSVKDKTCEL